MALQPWVDLNREHKISTVASRNHASSTSQVQTGPCALNPSIGCVGALASVAHLCEVRESKKLYAGASSSVLTTWPNQRICWIFMRLIIFITPLRSHSSRFHLLRYLTLTRTAAKTLLRTVLSHAPSTFSSPFVIVHISAPYNRKGMITDL